MKTKWCFVLAPWDYVVVGEGCQWMWKSFYFIRMNDSWNGKLNSTHNVAFGASNWILGRERLTFRINKPNPIGIVTTPNCSVHRMVNRQICRRLHDRTSQRNHSVNEKKNRIKLQKLFAVRLPVNRFGESVRMQCSKNCRKIMLWHRMTRPLSCQSMLISKTMLSYIRFNYRTLWYK